MYFADLVCAEERAEDAGVDGTDGANAASGDACDTQRLARGTRELCEEGHDELMVKRIVRVTRVIPRMIQIWMEPGAPRGSFVALWGCSVLYYHTMF